MSGKAYTAITDYKGEFTFDVDQKDFKGQIQATKGENTSSIREMQIYTDNPRAINLEIIDSASTPIQSQPKWPVQQTAPAKWPVQQTAPAKWPVQQTAPAQNSVW